MVHKHVRINQDSVNNIMYNKNQIRKDEDICGDRNLLDIVSFVAGCFISCKRLCEIIHIRQTSPGSTPVVLIRY